MRNRTVAPALIAILSVIALTGCTSPTPESAETPVAVKPSAKPTPSATPTPSGTPSPTATGWWENCDGLASISITGRSEGDEEPKLWAQWNGLELTDNGATEFARGTVKNTAGGRISYTVAAGDGQHAIVTRLCADVGSLMNYSNLGPVLHPGDVLVIPDTMKPYTPEPWVDSPQG